MPRTPGTKPKSTEQKVLDGVRDSRINHDAPVARATLPVMPDYDEAHPEEREVWSAAVEELEFMGIAKSADADLLWAYVQAVIQHREATRLLRTDDLLIEGRDGNLVKNPLIQIRRDAAKAVQVFGAEFGFSPSARSRIAAGGKDGDEEDNPY